VIYLSHTRPSFKMFHFPLGVDTHASTNSLGLLQCSSFPSAKPSRLRTATWCSTGRSLRRFSCQLNRRQAVVTDYSPPGSLFHPMPKHGEFLKTHCGWERSGLSHRPTTQHNTTQHSTTQLDSKVLALTYQLLCCIVLCCIVLCCIVLCCIGLCCIVLCCIVLCVSCVVLCCVVLYCVVLYCVVLYCVVLYRVVLYCVVLYCVVLYCVVCVS
jgi:hypothetical protein